MRKRLLLAFTAILCVISSSAVQVGDYVFTHSGRYKVIGENLVANGNFTANYDGWTDITAMPISPDFWSVQEGAGPNGQNVLQSLSNADEQNGAFIFQSIPFEPSKSYIITLKIKSAEPGTSMSMQVLRLLPIRVLSVSSRLLQQRLCRLNGLSIHSHSPTLLLVVQLVISILLSVVCFPSLRSQTSQLMR